MKYVKEILRKHDKTANDFINYLCDERKNLGLEEYKDRNMVRIDSNCGSGGKIYINEDLMPILNDYLNE